MSLASNSIKSELVDAKNQFQNTSVDISKEFKSFLKDVESLVKETSSLTGDDLAKAKEKLNQRIDQAKQQVNDVSGNFIQQARKTAAVTNEYVHEQPWAAIGSVAALSFLAGFLIARQD